MLFELYYEIMLESFPGTSTKQ